MIIRDHKPAIARSRQFIRRRDGLARNCPNMPHLTSPSHDIKDLDRRIRPKFGRIQIPALSIDRRPMIDHPEPQRRQIHDLDVEAMQIQALVARRTHVAARFQLP